MDLLEKLVTEVRSEQDNLVRLVNAEGGPSRLVDKLRARVDVNWEVAAAKCAEKAASVMQGLQRRSEQEGLVMDEQTRGHVQHLALREAVCQQVTLLLSASSPRQQDPASPYTQGARFNQLQSFHLSRLSRGVYSEALLPSYLLSEWEALAVLDAERAHKEGLLQGFLVLNASQDRFRFPALVSIFELLAAFPRELNMKLGSRFGELSNKIYLCQDRVALASSTEECLLLSYHFSRSQCRDARVLLLSNGCESYGYARNSACVVRLPGGCEHEVRVTPNDGAHWIIVAVCDHVST